MTRLQGAFLIAGLCTMLSFCFAACGGGSGGNGETNTNNTDTYNVGGTVSGLSGTGLALQQGGGDNLVITEDGAFTFPTEVADGADYTVTVLTQPSLPDQTCTVNSGSGTVAGANVTNVKVICSRGAYTVGGTVTGLLGTGLVLQQGGGDGLAITEDGAFTFPTEVADGADYTVTVLTQPSSPNQICTVNGGTGTVTGADVTNITVTCSTAAYTVGGTVTGLEGLNNYVILINNGSDYLEIYGKGSFTFVDSVADGADYAVTIGTQPQNPQQTCTVNGGSGTVTGANVTDIVVTCSTNSYAIGGTANGISGDVILQNNGSDDLTIKSDGTFTFSAPVADTADYDVTVLSSLGLGCELLNESGTVSGSDVTDVELSCGPVTASVEALYNNSGTDWNDYVINDGWAGIFTATDKACPTDWSLQGYDSCLHGGEMRAVEVPGLSSCIELTASDGLGAFDWVCDDSTFPVRMVSTGLKEGINLSDLLDFSSPGWKDNYVTVLYGGVEHFTTAPDVWWSNSVIVDNDGGYLDSAGTIYVVKDDLLTPATGGYIINAPSVGLVAQPGVIINGPSAGAGSYVIWADGFTRQRDFLWLEGAVDAAGDEAGVKLNYIGYSVLKDVMAENANAATPAGMDIRASANNKFSGLTASNNNGTGIFLYSANSTVSGVKASNNSGIGMILNHYSSYSTVSDVTASNNGGTGVFFNQVRECTFTGLTASNNGGDGIYIVNTSFGNRLTGVTASNNAGSGIYIYISPENILSGVTASNNGSDGVYLNESRNNTLSGVTASNNGGSGVYLDPDSDSNAISTLTATDNNVFGVYVGVTRNNTLSSVTASNNGNYGVYLYAPADSTLSGLATTDNSSYGLRLFNVEYGYFTGPLKVGYNGDGDCLVSGGIDPGLVDLACGIQGSSDASLTNSVTLASSFMGKVYSDAVNSSDTGSAINYPSDTAAFDWSDFENPFRGWGNDGTFGDVSSQGQWVAGLGAIWDRSLDLDDTEIKDALTFPTGNDTLTHTWYTLNVPASQSDCSVLNPDYVFSVDHCENTFLRNAVEIQGDGIGNDNTLCESDETCIHTPNIGSYQGHGNLISAGSFTEGTLTGITLKQYETNGY